MILSYQGKKPRIANGVYIAPSADIIGDVEIGEHSSIWFQVVIRGDVHSVRIGTCSNIQDGSVLHVHRGEYPLTLGDYVTVGHSATLHGCTVESNCLIGMGATVLNNARIGTGSIVAAGSLVPEDTVVPPQSLFMGTPARFIRRLKEAEQEKILQYARNYLEYKEIYLKESGNSFSAP
ncbi:MAG: gamma carbonic anhydrase family protein [Acidobacteriia bacterium]|nr:gamma carbonic anhydrase family protein [Terriglobia bacterium]